MSYTKPPPFDREPDCIHSTWKHRVTQPASACSTCKNSRELREWKEGWRIWFEANPGEARKLKRLNDRDPHA